MLLDFLIGGTFFEKALSSFQRSGSLGLNQDLLEVLIFFPAHKTSSPWTGSVDVFPMTPFDSDHQFDMCGFLFRPQSNSPHQLGVLQFNSILTPSTWR